MKYYIIEKNRSVNCEIVKTVMLWELVPENKLFEHWQDLGQYPADETYLRAVDRIWDTPDLEIVDCYFAMEVSPKLVTELLTGSESNREGVKKSKTEPKKHKPNLQKLKGDF